MGGIEASPIIFYLGIEYAVGDPYSYPDVGGL